MHSRNWEVMQDEKQLQELDYLVALERQEFSNFLLFVSLHSQVAHLLLGMSLGFCFLVLQTYLSSCLPMVSLACDFCCSRFLIVSQLLFLFHLPTHESLSLIHIQTLQERESERFHLSPLSAGRDFCVRPQVCCSWSGFYTWTSQLPVVQEVGSHGMNIAIYASRTPQLGAVSWDPLGKV